jgi:GTP-dependent phosphoenolpyruvate carboxykinase
MTDDMRMTWVSAGWRQWVLHDDAGKIQGSVDGGFRCYNASAGCLPLGAYITEDAAKAAVEKRVRAFLPAPSHPLGA